MKSVKTVFVVLVFLGIVYGVYQVINKQGKYVEDDSPIVGANGEALVSEFGVEIDPEKMTDEEIEAALFGPNSGSFGQSAADGDESLASNDFNFDIGDDNASSFSTQEDEQADRQAPRLLNDAIDAVAEKSPAPAKTPFGNASFKSNDTGIDFVPVKNRENNSLELPETGDTQDFDESELNKDFNSFQPEANATQSQSLGAPVSTQNTGNLREIPGYGSSFAGDTESLDAGDGTFDGNSETLESIPENFEGTLGTLASDAKALNGEEPKASGDTPQFSAAQLAELQKSGFGPADLGELAEHVADAQAAVPQPRNAQTGNTNYSLDLAATWDRARILIERGQFREALEVLSVYHDDPRLTAAEHQNLLSWIDPLAGKVIYSTEHLVTQGYVVSAGDTLEKIAAKYKLSPQLVYNINRQNIDNPNMLRAGTTLKVVDGPFDAAVNMHTNKLTLTLDGMYAGHFVVSLGDAAAMPAGTYVVEQKSDAGHDYFPAGDAVIAAGDPRNPYGRYWIGLNNGFAIHSSADSGDSADTRGCVSLSPIDAQDVFGILTVGSKVTVRR